MKEIIENEQIRQYINKKIAKSVYNFIMRFLLFVLFLFLTGFFIYSYFPLAEFANKCMHIFPILAKFIMFVCSHIGKIALTINAFLLFFIIELTKLKHIK